MQYFEIRQRACRDSREKAMAVEQLVIRDVRNVIRSCFFADIMTIELLFRQALGHNTAAQDYYAANRKSLMVSLLWDIFVIPRFATELSQLNKIPLDFDGVVIPDGDFIVPLANGGQLRSGWIDKADPDELPAGDYLSVIDKHGEQVFYITADDLFALSAVEGKKLLFSFLQACAGN